MDSYYRTYYPILTTEEEKPSVKSINCGKYNNNNVRPSPYGIAIKNKDGLFVVYDN